MDLEQIVSKGEDWTNVPQVTVKRRAVVRTVTKFWVAEEREIS
jgi:hypothetical protein